MMEMRIERAGMFSVVQDLGRYGHQRFGVPVNGAMDEWAHRLANALVGNDEQAATLECLLTGPTLRFTHNALIALTGGDFHAEIEGTRLPMNQPLMVRRDVPITFAQQRSGARAYIAVRGGINTPPVLGSRSTFVRAGYGGWEGRALVRGDRLPIGALSSHMLSIERLLVQTGSTYVSLGLLDGVAALLDADPSQPIRFMRGPQWRRFTLASRAAFMQQPYTVTQQSDRMGYRLQGTPLNLNAPLEMISEAVNVGTIQVPPNGEPILLMADRQTAGGYPKLGYVATADISRVAQALPGDALRFTPIAQRQAERLLWLRYRQLADIANAAARVLT